MIVYLANSDEILEIAAPHDPDAELFYGFKFKPEAWQPNTVYDKMRSIVVPTVPNGYVYPIESNGISGATEPAWKTKKKEITIDNTVEYKAAEYNIFLYSDETLTGSTWEATDLVPIASESFTAEGETLVKVGPIPDGVSQFTITNHVTKNTTEKDDRSLIINVKER